MKVEFWCKTDTNVIARTDIFDTGNHLGISDEEWLTMSEKDKIEIVKEWMCERFEYGVKTL